MTPSLPLPGDPGSAFLLVGDRTMNPIKHLKLALLRRRAFRRVRAELENYSERELMADLRLNRSAIPDLAAEAADQQLAAFVRSHPEYRAA
jgi:hypothetical protein